MDTSVQAPVYKASAAVLLIKSTAGQRFDVMNGAKKTGFAKILEQKWAKLLILQCFAGKKAEPVIRINNFCRRIRG